MISDEIKRIPELQIEIDDLAEQCFYIKMVALGKISRDIGEKTLENIKGIFSAEEYETALRTADKMIANIEKYGVLCAAWA